MHILIIHQAFASLDEPGGTRHYELARYLVDRGHRVTVIASKISYLTGTNLQSHDRAERNGADARPGDEAGDTTAITVLRASAYTAHHKSFFHRLLAFLSFMFSSFFLGLRVPHVDVAKKVMTVDPPDGLLD